MNRRRFLLAIFIATVAGCRGGDPVEASFDRAVEHYERAEYDAAIELLRQGLESRPGSATGHNLLGMAYRMKYTTAPEARWREMETEAFRRAIQADSTFWPAYINLGATLYYGGKRDEAAPYLRRALDLNPDNPERRELEAMIAGETPASSAD